MVARMRLLPVFALLMCFQPAASTIESADVLATVGRKLKDGAKNRGRGHNHGNQEKSEGGYEFGSNWLMDIMCVLGTSAGACCFITYIARQARSWYQFSKSLSAAREEKRKKIRREKEIVQKCVSDGHHHRNLDMTETAGQCCDLCDFDLTGCNVAVYCPQCSFNFCGNCTTASTLRALCEFDTSQYNCSSSGSNGRRVRLELDGAPQCQCDTALPPVLLGSRTVNVKSDTW